MPDIYTERFLRLADAYSSIEKFISSHEELRYSDFDRMVERDVNLFAMSENFDFVGTEKTVDAILAAVPAIKRIYARPITHLKTTSVILPIESVHFFDNRTILHAANHSEQWEDITDEGIKPRKLLTQNNIDTYKIYENVAFAHAINISRSFIAHNIRILKELVYNDRNMRFNLLERINHIDYFLAIGKLHTGYVRHYDKYRIMAERLLNKLMFAQRIIMSGTGRAVYRKCRNEDKNFTLKKTNILKMHKDYHRIFVLLPYFSDRNISEIQEPLGTDAENLYCGYYDYCKLLVIFSAGHFNFQCADGETIIPDSLSVKFTFGDYALTVSSMDCSENGCICLDFHKDADYRAVLIPCIKRENRDSVAESVKNTVAADEYLTVTPFDDGGDVYIDISDIDSFRRIQQIILRGMVYSDKKRNVCPFCGEGLKPSSPDGNTQFTDSDIPHPPVPENPKNSEYPNDNDSEKRHKTVNSENTDSNVFSSRTYECVYCRTTISDNECTVCKRHFISTGIKSFIPADITHGLFGIDGYDNSYSYDHELSYDAMPRPFADDELRSDGETYNTPLRKNDNDDSDLRLRRRAMKARMHFRNITDIGEDLSPLCPGCHTPVGYRKNSDII